jgi:lincosamide nucleotidyltransferase A/C/D/E
VSAEVEADDVVRLLDLLDEVEVAAWVDGGWGVDALLREQTRPHRDLDLIVRDDQAGLMRDTLSRTGFDRHRGPDWNFVLRDTEGREVDAHTVRFDGQGRGHFMTESGEPFVREADAFTGTGRILERVVRCLSAQAQMINHATGDYVPAESDVHDMRLLNERLGTPLLPPYSQPEMERRP